jgi:hypothetical protein
MSYDSFPNSLAGYLDGVDTLRNAGTEVPSRSKKLQKSYDKGPGFRYDSLQIDPVREVDEMTGAICIGSGLDQSSGFLRSTFPTTEVFPTRHDLDKHVGNFVVLAQHDKNSELLQPIHSTKSPSEAVQYSTDLYQNKGIASHVVVPLGAGKYHVLRSYGL